MFCKSATLLFLATFLSGSLAGNNNNSPRLVRQHDGQLVPKYHGLVKENTRVVNLRPKLHAIDGDTGKEGDICGYEIYATEGQVPFSIQIVPGSKDGSATVSVLPAYSVDFEEKQLYEFDIAAYDCGDSPNYSHRIPVVIEVEDVNEFAPEFENATYFTAINSGPLNDAQLLTLTAKDGDASVLYKEICRYDIITLRDVPFRIDKSGTLRPIKELDWKVNKKFEFDVVAEDCGGMKSSKPAHVVVTVLPPCSDKIGGVPDSIFYHALSGRLLLFPNISYQFCAPASTCKKVESATATVSLLPKDSSANTDQPQCALDNVSLTARRKYCKVGDNTVLLPLKPIEDVDQEAEYPPNDAVVSFDGNAQPVPVNATLLLGKTTPVGFGRTFVAHFWMRRIGDPNERYPTRQHILCYENGTISNVDIAVRGCSLQLDVAMTRGSIYFWTWNVPQLCNGRWHHYAISVVGSGSSGAPEVTLYIDGLVETNPANGPGVADFVTDSSARNDPQIRIGGCPSLPLSEFLIADLADVNVLIGQKEILQAIRCLSDCRERLSVTDMSDLKSQMTMSFNADNTQLIVSGSTVDDVIKVVRDVQYSNTHLLPEYGDRMLTIDVKAICSSGSEINVPRLETAASVSLPYDTSLLVGGLHGIFVSSSHFSKPGLGVRLFPDLTLSAKLDFGHSGLPPDAQLTDDIVKLLVRRKLSTLTECVITLDRDASNNSPNLDSLLRNEHIVAPMQLADKYGLEVESDPTGQLLVRGAKRAAVYQRFLRQIEYSVEPSQGLMSTPSIVRRFSLTCAYDDTRILSATYAVELTLAGAPGSAPLSSHTPKKRPEYGEDGKAASISAFVETGSAAGVGIALLIVIAVALIVIALVIIACRRRQTRRRRGSDASRQRLVGNGKNPDDMEWDNSGFNVVVNPLSGAEDEVVIHDSGKGRSLTSEDSGHQGDNYAYEGDEEYMEDYESESDLDDEAAFTGGRAGRLLLASRQNQSGQSSPVNKKVIPVPPALVDEEAGHDVI